MGTELQAMGVPMDSTAWAAAALSSHPYTVRQTHERYVSGVADTSAGLRVLREKWRGPIGVYPEASRSDYTATFRDDTEPNAMSPAEYLAQARQWVAEGVQVVGGCCGIGVEYIRALRDGLPRTVPGAARG